MVQEQDCLRLLLVGVDGDDASLAWSSTAKTAASATSLETRVGDTTDATSDAYTLRTLQSCIADVVPALDVWNKQDATVATCRLAACRCPPRRTATSSRSAPALAQSPLGRPRPKSSTERARHIDALAHVTRHLAQADATGVPPPGARPGDRRAACG
jgi:hypothetical protein